MRRRTEKRRNSTRRKVTAGLVLFLVLSVAAISYYDKKLVPVIEAVGMSDAQDIATEAINNAIRKTLSKKEIDYSGLTLIDKDSEGRIVSVTTDPETVNRLTTDLTLNVLNALKGLNETEIGIALGSFTDSQLLSGRGPKIKVKLCPTQSVFTDIETTFEAVGINQTRHRVSVKVTVSLDLLFPTEIKTAECSETVVVAETVIVGEVPQFYRPTITDK